MTAGTTRDSRLDDLRQQIAAQAQIHRCARRYNKICVYVLSALSFMAGAVIALLTVYEECSLPVKATTAVLAFMSPSLAKLAELHDRLERQSASTEGRWLNLADGTKVSTADPDSVIAEIQAQRDSDAAERSGKPSKRG
jgi:hypothetical protein